MTARTNRNLLIVCKRYKQRYVVSGKKPDLKKLLANDLYHTTRLEGEKITKKEAKDLINKFAV